MKKHKTLLALLLMSAFIFTACSSLPIPGISEDQPENTISQQIKSEPEPEPEPIEEELLPDEDFTEEGPLEGLFDEVVALTPEDCFEGEEYDPVEKTCYIECETELECQQKELEILKQIEAIGEDFYEGEQDFQEPERAPGDSDEGEVEGALVTYMVENGTLTNPKKANNITKADEIALQEDVNKHQRMWSYFTSLFPSTFTADVAEFEVFTDGKEGTFGAVAQTERDPTKWLLSMDIADAFQGEEFNTAELTYTLIHEFGHLLTLNQTQVNLDLELFNYTGEDVQNLYLQKEKACRPNFFIQEGCAKEGSTINAFFIEFWADKNDEKQKIEEIEDDTEYEKAALDFYEKYQDQFVTEYASSNPVEDIAESWTAFILREKPENPTTVAEKKIAFFYNYPILVDLQKHVRDNIVKPKKVEASGETVNN